MSFESYLAEYVQVPSPSRSLLAVVFGALMSKIQRADWLAEPEHEGSWNRYWVPSSSLDQKAAPLAVKPDLIYVPAMLLTHPPRTIRSRGGHVSDTSMQMPPGSTRRCAQSEQSVPHVHTVYSAPGPPSSQKFCNGGNRRRFNAREVLAVSSQTRVSRRAVPSRVRTHIPAVGA